MLDTNQQSVALLQQVTTGACIRSQTRFSLQVLMMAHGEPESQTPNVTNARGITSPMTSPKAAVSTAVVSVSTADIVSQRISLRITPCEE